MGTATININIFSILCFVYITILIIIIKILLQRDKKLKIEKYRIDVEYSDDNIENKLDFIIDSVFDEYRLYNLDFRDESYIKEMEEKEIIIDICNLVLERLSPIFISRLCVYFNKDSLGKIIATKISTKVMEYRIKNNISMSNNNNRG